VSELKIGTTGLSEFNRALRKLDTEAPKQLRVANNEAADLLIAHVRPLIPSRSGAARRSLKAKSTRTSARISVGGRTAPYYPWLDFGGRTGIRKSVKRPFLKEGRYIFPTLRKIRPKIMAQLEKSLTAAARSAGLDVD
jgi:hypothetical protein